jgi:biopolymer transport protein ExbB
MLKKLMLIVLLAGLITGLGGFTMQAMAQEEGEVAQGMELTDEAAAADDGGGAGFFTVIVGSGIVGIILWLALGACSVAGVALIVDSFITVRQAKIAPPTLVEQVQEAMEQGDVMKALKHCEEQPGPLAHVLTAGFANVQEGFEAIQDAVAVAADQESERLLQRVNYLNVVGNLSPSLGLLGTVQGMIYAFATLATQTAGAGQQSALAMNISQALYTTAAGLCVSVPAVGFFYFFKNKAMNIILGMEAKTMDLIKVLRNVEVVEE